jgi:hypothetical protein
MLQLLQMLLQRHHSALQVPLVLLQLLQVLLALGMLLSGGCVQIMGAEGWAVCKSVRTCRCGLSKSLANMQQAISARDRG